LVEIDGSEPPTSAMQAKALPVELHPQAAVKIIIY